MEAIILISQSKEDLKLLKQVADRLGMKSKKLTKSQLDDFTLGFAMQTAKTDEFVNTKAFKKKLRK